MDIITILKSIDLFDMLNNDELDLIIRSLTIEDYKKNNIIIGEGDLADALYIIASGSVQVFTFDAEQKELILARLDAGKYFGEQAYLNNFIRNASIKALTDVSLIQIKYSILEKVISHFPKIKNTLEYNSIKNSLIKIENQFINMNSELSELFKKLKNDYLENKTKKNILTFIKNWLHFNKEDIRHVSYPKQAVIFKKGDASDFVCFIIFGSVQIILNEHQDEDKIILTKGHIFGELGVITEQRRSATAIANENTEILTVKKNYFLRITQQSKSFKFFHYPLKKMYALPRRGVLEQHFGKIENDTALISIYKLDDKRTVISSSALNQQIFSMNSVGEIADATFEFKRGDLIERKIMIKNNVITGIFCVGKWDELNFLCILLLDKIKIPSESADFFVKTGNFLSIPAAVEQEKDLVCSCMSISFSKIKNAIAKGNLTLNAISKETGAGNVCGACKDKILTILGESSWFYGTIVLNRQYTENVYSFLIKPLYGTLPKFHPGQFIIIKLQVNGRWIERAYTITSKINNEFYEILVKVNINGLFSQWLVKHKDDPSFVWVSKPQGNFIPKKNVRSLICFAGGIGITPFISFLRNASFERIFILYAVESAEEAVIPDDVKNMLSQNNNIQCEIWVTETQGFLSENKIIDLYKKADLAYICGPDGFLRVVKNSLLILLVDPDSIITEEFVPAG